MICAKNYEKLSKFVKVTAKILSVLFSGHGVVTINKLYEVEYELLIGIIFDAFE